MESGAGARDCRHRRGRAIMVGAPEGAKPRVQGKRGELRPQNGPERLQRPPQHPRCKTRPLVRTLATQVINHVGCVIVPRMEENLCGKNTSLVTLKVMVTHHTRATKTIALSGIGTSFSTVQYSEREKKSGVTSPVPVPVHCVHLGVREICVFGCVT